MEFTTDTLETLLRRSTNITANEESLSIAILDKIDTVLAAFGFICNAAALITFIKNGQTFGYPIRELLIHQAFLDMMACLIGFIIHCQPFYWHVKNFYWEVINCYLWHSQYFFWHLLNTSANNLVYLAYDRYRAVVHPLHYKDISKTKVNIGFLFTHIYTTICRWPLFLWVGSRINLGIVMTHIYTTVWRWPLVLWVRMNNDKCEPGYVLQGKLAEITSKCYAVVGFLVFYFYPLLALIYLYGKVVRSSRKALKLQERTTSAATQKALSVVTKAAIVVTLIFILTFSVIYWNFTLGIFFGWFVLGTISQRTNVLAGSINSSCNPAIYCVFMPSFRRALIQTFIPCFHQEHSRHPDNNSGGQTSVSTILRH